MVGPVEEIGKVAGTALDIVRGQPMILALILFNLLFAILVYLGSKDFRSNQLELMKMMIEVSKESQQLLSQCITPPSDRRGELELWMLPPQIPAAASDPPP